MNDLGEKIRKLDFKNNKKLLLIILAAIGILLLWLSSTGEGLKDEKEEPKEDITLTDEEYCESLEGKVKSIVAAITGDNTCLVAITLESSTEYVYADQNKTDKDIAESEGTVTKESVKSEQEYIIVKGKDGSQNALMVTAKKPAVRGVAIVAKGINAISKEQITESVSAILGITSRRISINPST